MIVIPPASDLEFRLDILRKRNMQILGARCPRKESAFREVFSRSYNTAYRIKRRTEAPIEYLREREFLADFIERKRYREI